MRVDFAVFNALSTTGDNAGLLDELTFRVRNTGCKVDQSALAFKEGGRIKFYGTPTLVDFLSKNGVPQCNKVLEV
jgi:hypothetical protein